MRRTALWLAVGVLGVGIYACGSDAEKVPRQVTDFWSAAETSDGSASGALVEGAPPDPSGGPAPAGSVGQGTIVNGSTASATLTSDVAFAAVIISVEDSENHFEMLLEDPVTEVECVMTGARAIPEDAFTNVYQLVDVNGLVGPPVSQDFLVREAEQTP